MMDWVTALKLFIVIEGVVCAMFVALFVIAACKVSSMCSREEEDAVRYPCPKHYEITEDD